ncbi:MAG TPA: hypothetical protein DHW07_04390 [Gammaproteobacteria bacterium]|nr:hypothetical protein [Gammaproteobacteria bacterium]|tara:strand:- start:689 stop:1270 length:582 start_codon:yes stop_codon:yes gene_type:complete
MLVEKVITVASSLIFSVAAFPVLAFSLAVSVGGAPAKIPVNSTVTVHQLLSVTAGKSRVYFQHGKLLSRIEHTYDPYCYFSMKRPRAEMKSPTNILPATFTVTKQFRRKEQTARLGTMIASSFNIGVGSHWWLAFNEGGPQNLNHHLRLAPSDQPQVTALVCGVYADPMERSTPSLTEVVEALGAFATIQKAG